MPTLSVLPDQLRLWEVGVVRVRYVDNAERCSLDLHVNGAGMERATRATQRAKGEGQPHVTGKVCLTSPAKSLAPLAN